MPASIAREAFLAVFRTRYKRVSTWRIDGLVDSMSGVSFKIQAPGRPTAPPRQSTSSRRFDDTSDDEREERGRERVTEFGKPASLSKQQQQAATAKPLVIPSLPNKEWQSSSKKKQHYVPGLSDPPARSAPTIGKVEVDTVNSAPIQGGLAPRAPVTTASTASNDEQQPMQVDTATTGEPAKEQQQETEEQRALRELLKQSTVSSKDPLDDLVLPSGPDRIVNGNRSQEARETDAFKADVESRPDSAGLDAYERIPVAQFGAAMLRGMGWKEGTPASKTGRTGPTEAYVTPARPALLGIGAKPIDPELVASSSSSSTSKNKPPKDRKAEYKFTPLVRVERNEAAASSASSSNSRQPSYDSSSSADDRPSSSMRRYHSDSEVRSSSSARTARSRSRSPPPNDKSHSRDRERDRDREREKRRDYDSDRSHRRDREHPYHSSSSSSSRRTYSDRR